MRFLVFGATGMAGHMVSLYLAERGHEVFGTARRAADCLEQRGVRIISLDVCDSTAVKDILVNGCYDVVVNCVGLLNKACDERPDLAVYLNSYFPHLLEVVTRDMNTRVFHLSTDCVFAGNAGPYVEGSIHDGVTFYDRTKSIGEIINRKDLTLRQSIVGPDTNETGIGLFNWFMRQNDIVRGFSGAIWTGLTTLELAKAIECASLEEVSGLVNMVPEFNISKYKLLLLFNRHCRNGKIRVVESNKVQLDKSLVRTNFSCSFRPSSYDVQVAEMADWIKNHIELYPHYEIG